MSLEMEIRVNGVYNENVANDIFTIIKKRHSVRSYANKRVSDEVIKVLIDLATRAPSSRNLKPLIFLVITNSQMLDEISEKSKVDFLQSFERYDEKMEELGHLLASPDINIFYNAPALIIICAKENAPTNDESEAVSDCFLAGENLMLAAFGMGLGTCPIGLSLPILCHDEMRKKLEIPNGYIPALPIVVGYPEAIFSSFDRQRPEIKWLQ